jgi:hypothetical protein
MIDRAHWISIPIDGTDMQRINSSYFYILAQKLIPLRGINTEATIMDFYGEIFQAELQLRSFLFNPLLPPLTSYTTGKSLLDALQQVQADAFREEAKFTWSEVQAIVGGLTNFEIVLQSDFGTRDTFIVSPKRTYSTTLLVENGETLVSEAALDLVKGMTKDLQDAGRCIAFELPTAASFHLFRAVEAMVSGYGEFVRGKEFTDFERRKGLGGYANCLKESTLDVDKRIIGAIEQISSLYRNPTMHPEMHITNTQIIVTLGMAVSVIEIVAIDWIRRKDTPGVPLLEILPDDSKIEILETEHSGTKELGVGGSTQV